MMGWSVCMFVVWVEKIVLETLGFNPWDDAPSLSSSKGIGYLGFGPQQLFAGGDSETEWRDVNRGGERTVQPGEERVLKR